MLDRLAAVLGPGRLLAAVPGDEVAGALRRLWGERPGDAEPQPGLLRTSMYLGAIASASLIGLRYGRQATDAGLHQLAVILVIAAAALLAVTLADRSTLEACSEQ